MSTNRPTSPLPRSVVALPALCGLPFYAVARTWAITIVRACALVVMAGCASDSEPPNQPPMVTITSGPVEGSEVDFRVRVGWEGSDPDGRVVRYEYAIDPPVEFTEEEMLRGGPGFDWMDLPAEDGSPARSRMSKTVPGGSVFVDWFHSTDPDQDFNFSAANAESVCVDTTCAPTGRATGCHTVYVRAVDNRDAASEADRVAFTATTIVPETRFTYPAVERELLTVGQHFRVQVGMEDPDGSTTTSGTPFLYKLINLFDDLNPPVDHFRVQSTDIFLGPDTPPWQFNDGSAPLDLLLNTPKQYVLAVRAIDPAGAADPFLEWNRNAIKMQAFPTAGFPSLQVCEEVIGCDDYMGSGHTFSAQVPTGVPLDFSWSASAEAYGGAIWGYSWGVDIVDLEAEGPGSGWSGWGAQVRGTPQPLVFNDPGFHVLYVRARDLAGVTTLGTLFLEVVEMTFDREALLVDDSRDGVQPSDFQRDQFWLDLVDKSGRFDGEPVDVFPTYGDNDVGSLSPLLLTLEDMSRYRLLIWDYSGPGGRSDQASNERQIRILAMYLRAGGTLWLSGTGTNGFIRPGGLGEQPGDRFDFGKEFLKLTTLSRDSEGFFAYAQPVVPPGGGESTYPEMRVDLDKLNRVSQQDGGITGVEALFDPIFPSSLPGFTGEIESLYTYGAVGETSPFQNRLCATRWHDPDPQRPQGRVQWFGFQMYYMFDDQAQEVFNRTIDWFREETAAP